MKINEEIESKYDEILKISKEFDTCFVKKEEGTWTKEEISDKKVKDYWRLREKLEGDITAWMQLLRKAIESIHDDAKKYTPLNRVDPSGEEYTVRDYDNDNFSSLNDFFEKIKRSTEGTILVKIQTKKPIYEQVREIRGDVLSFSRTMDLFIPEKMITIERQVKIIFKLKELGMEEAASELEKIDDEEDNRKKALLARTALEKVVEQFCKNKSIKPTGFFNNLDKAIKAGLTDKTKREAIAQLYSFTSKIIHKDIEANSRNTQFAVVGVLNSIDSLIGA